MSNSGGGKHTYIVWRKNHDFHFFIGFFQNQWQNQTTLRQLGIAKGMWQANGLKIFQFWWNGEILWPKESKTANLAVLGEKSLKWPLWAQFSSQIQNFCVRALTRVATIAQAIKLGGHEKCYLGWLSRLRNQYT